MTKSYFFNCDDFILDDQGGTFIRGKRRFSLKIGSTQLSQKIQQHVQQKSCFPETEYPVNVLLTLLRNGLLKPKMDEGARSSIEHLFSHIQILCGNILRQVQSAFERDFFYAYLKLRLSSISQGMSNQGTMVIIPESIVKVMVRPWAWLLNPIGIVLLGVFNVLWLAWESGGNWPRIEELRNAHHLNPYTILLILLISFILHELAHAASAYSVNGQCGAVRWRRLFFVFPFLAAHLPNLQNCKPVDRLAISAAGPVFQISCSILLLQSFAQSPSICYASLISILVALLNFIPFQGSDGYWMLVEILSGRRPELSLKWGTAKPIDIIYTILLFTIVLVSCGFVAGYFGRI